jgi:quinol monooxygenase YgiN
MTHVARYGKMTARDGAGAELAGILLQAALDLKDDPGCLVYLVQRQADAPDTVWVTEVWRSQEDLDAVVERIRGSEALAAAMALVTGAQMVELDLVGGKGLPSAD